MRNIIVGKAVMATIFIALYNYFQKRKLVLWGLLIAILALAGYSIMHIELEEDISKIIPLDKEVSKINIAYQNSKFSDKLLFHVALEDTTNLGVDDLVNYTDSLVLALSQKFDSTQIKEIQHKLSDNTVLELYELFYKHLPIFLNEEDYKNIASRVDAKGVNKTLQSVYKTLISPTSFILKKNVLKDPMGLASLPLRRLQDFQLEGDYTIHNNRIVTKDKKHLLFFATPANAPNETGKNAAFCKQLDIFVAQAKIAFGEQVSIEYFGSIAVAAANAEQIKKDINYTVSIALGILIILISLFFRRLLAFVLIFVPVIYGAAIGVASLVLLKPSISAISLGIGSVLLGITLDFSLHIFTHYRSVGNVHKTLEDLSTPMLMSALTTSSAFLCLLYMTSEALRDLGLFAAIAVFSAAIFALLILPHFLESKKPQKVVKHNSIFDKLAAYPSHQNKWLVGGVVLFSIVCLFFWGKVGFEEDMNQINYMPQHLATADQNLQKMSGASLKNTFLIANGKDVDAALEINDGLVKELEELKAKGLIQDFTSISSLYNSKHTQEQKIERWQQFWATQNPDSIQQRYINEGQNFKFKATAFQDFFELLQQEFKPVELSDLGALESLVLGEYITQKAETTTISSIIKLDDSQKEAIYDHFKGREQVVIFDRQYLTDQFVRLLKVDFGNLVNFSFLVVFIILLLAFGRIELAVLTFLPIALSWLWTLGLMGIFGIKFNIVNIIISTFIFGLGIDYSIFVTKGLLQEYKYGEKALNSYKTSILLSALTTTCGMGVLIFAKHPALQSIAALSIIGIISVVFIAFIIQPIIFGWVMLNRKEKNLPPYTLSSMVATVIAYTYFLTGCLLLSILALSLQITPAPKKTKKHLYHKVLSHFAASLIYLMFNVKKQFIERHKATFEKPAVIIANHQSFLDIILMIMLHPKIVLMTNDWVWNSPFFGYLIKFADFYPASQGTEEGLEKLGKLADEGYSIMIFPEGTRSKTGKIGRFKKGAFFLAEKLGLDILPIVLHGTGECIRKNDFLVNSTTVTIKALPRIRPTDQEWGTTYSERTKSISKYFKVEYQKVRAWVETPDFYEPKLVANYIYKGPVLEWYTRIKVKFEEKYKPFDKLIPKNAFITDIGCGYGMMAYMLNLLSEQRTIEGIDYDEEKIQVAKEGFLKNNQVNFVAADASTYLLKNSDVFLISDMLHYIPRDSQHKLIRRCLDRLNNGGMLIIRDGDKDLEERHEGTKWTEIFSTKILGFNKVANEGLSFLSGKDIETIAADYGLSVERIDLTKKTSNIIFVIRK